MGIGEEVSKGQGREIRIYKQTITSIPLSPSVPKNSWTMSEYIKVW